MGSRIILIEDEPLIAADIEFAIQDAGYDVVGSARTVDEGLRLLKTTVCDGAVIDANLNGQSSKAIVDKLDLAAVPYIVVSGYTRDQIDFLKEGTVLIGKPFRMSDLTNAIRENLVREN
ncbi:response regulator [Roseovarius arcticus]|uniref:response regulator n=1 Tax=Roseovarius arcticus TaxID=2547404 RepID=UPI0014875C56|nr:response regulator [Roseovarius arcticus]